MVGLPPGALQGRGSGFRSRSGVVPAIRLSTVLAVLERPGIRAGQRSDHGGCAIRGGGHRLLQLLLRPSRPRSSHTRARRRHQADIPPRGRHSSQAVADGAADQPADRDGPPPRGPRRVAVCATGVGRLAADPGHDCVRAAAAWERARGHQRDEAGVSAVLWPPAARSCRARFDR